MFLNSGAPLYYSKNLTYNLNIIHNINFIIYHKKKETLLLSAIQARVLQRDSGENSSATFSHYCHLQGGHKVPLVENPNYTVNINTFLR
jgi:hypothetical protein